ncbi:hypothetical protein ACFLZC_02865 [Patescibacteria group bacterium]
MKTPDDISSFEEIKREFENKLPQNVETFNVLVAKDNGIDIGTLLSSPNYVYLCEEYAEKTAEMLATRLSKEVGYSEVESWAVVAVFLGVT